MIATPQAALLAGFVALAALTIVGYPLARRLFPEAALASALAPALGWAAFHALALPTFAVAGFGPGTAALFCAALLGAALVDLRRRPAAPDDRRRDGDPAVPGLALILAAALAAACAAVLLPGAAGDGVAFAPPIFDHSKVAIADAIARTGVPPQNPFFAAAGEPLTLVYYYLWHLGVATLAFAPGLDSWSADVGLTGFTAFAAFAATMGLATRLAGRSSAAYWALALCATSSGWPLLHAALGSEALAGWLSAYPALGSPLVQAVWAPQHLASAMAALVAALLMERLSRTPDALGAVALGLAAAAAFGSSLWVGGVALAAATAAVGALLFALAPPERRPGFAVACASAAAVAAVCAAPILLAQASAAAARVEGLPIALHPYEVLGERVPVDLQRALDLPAFWLVRLPLDIPAIWLIGAPGLALLIRRGAAGYGRGTALSLACATLASLATSWLLISTVLNNDLGWRAALIGFLALAAAGGAAASRFAARSWLLLPALLALLAGLSGAAAFLARDGGARPFAQGVEFARSTRLWEAVRRSSAPDERVAVNPLLFAEATPWPINLSWALLSDRPSCYAGWEFARPFAPLPRQAVERIDRAFVDLFAGRGGDAYALLRAHDCRLVALHRSDAAWAADPFAGDRRFLPLPAPEGWRLYRASPEPGGR